MKVVKKSDCNYMMFIGVVAVFGAVLCAWLRQALGSSAVILSCMFFGISVYTFLKAYSVLYIAYKCNFKRSVQMNKVKTTNREDAVAFANRFAAQLEAEAEREFWVSNKA